MRVKIEVAEDNDGLMAYMGVIDDAELDGLVNGRLTKPFILLDQVYWSYRKKAKTEWDEDSLLMVKYGEGCKKNCLGSMFIRCDRIRLISPLKDFAIDDGTIPELA